jgi:hypothetical protein
LELLRAITSQFKEMVVCSQVKPEPQVCPGSQRLRRSEEEEVTPIIPSHPVMNSINTGTHPKHLNC